MARANFLIVACILATWAVAAVNGTHQHYDPPVQSPTVAAAEVPSAMDCTSLVYNMMECISFLSVGSNDTAPDPSCCSGFKIVVDTDAECICEVLKSSVDLGLSIDMTKANSLPSACGISYFSVDSCDLSSAPAAAPANPPSTTTPAPPTTSPTPVPPSADPAPPTTTPTPPTTSPTPVPPSADPAPPTKTPTPVPPSADIAPAPSINNEGGIGVNEAPAPSPANSGAYAIAYSSVGVVILIPFILSILA